MKNTFYSRLTCTIFLLLFGCHSLFSQTLREIELSSPHRISATDVHQLSDGGFLFPCVAYPSPRDSVLAILIRTDSLFNILWTKRYKTYREDELSRITALADGNFLVGGTNRQSFALNEGGSVYKIDSAGNVIWHHVYAESHDDRILEMFEEKDGSLMLFIRHGVNNRPTKIVHADSAGNIISQRTYWDNFIGVFGEAVIQAQNGNCYMSGTYRDPGSRLYVLFVCAFNKTNMLWYKKCHFRASITSYGLLENNDKIYLSGRLPDSVNTNQQNGFIMKMDSLGSVEWTKEITHATSPLTIWGSSLLSREKNRIWMIGSSSNGIDNDGMVLEFDDQGSINWSKTYHGNSAYGFRTALKLSADRYLLYGSISNTILLMYSDGLGNSACSSAPLPVKTSPLVVKDSVQMRTHNNPGIVIDNPAYTILTESIVRNQLCASSFPGPEIIWGNKMRVFPIPTTDILKVELRNFVKKGQIELLDLRGKVVLKESIKHSNALSLNLSQYPAGLYLLKMSSENQVLTEKVIVE